MPVLLPTQAGHLPLYVLVLSSRASINCCVLTKPVIILQDLLKELDVPTVFTDYCEEASNLAASCISTITGRPLAVPVCYH